MEVRYRTDAGAALISVTQVLQLAGRIDTTWFTPEAAERGRIVHDLTEVYDRGGDLSGCPLHLVPYLDAYAEFMAVVRPTYAASEIKVTNALLGLGGRIDRVCSDLFGSPGILDFKTGAAYPWHGAQLAAYNVLRPSGARWACYLGPNGRYKLRRYDDPIDHRRFMADLAKTRGSVTADGDYWIAAA